MNCKCYIGIINDYDNTRMTTLDGLKIHIKESLYLKQAFETDPLYEPVPFGLVRTKNGIPFRHETEAKKWLDLSLPCDKRLADVVIRHGLPEKLFTHKIYQDHNVAQTLAAAGDYYRGFDKTKISAMDCVSVQTFPQDFDFLTDNPTFTQYICGMSVPPIMIKRIVTRLIEQGVYDYAKSVRTLQEKE